MNPFSPKQTPGAGFAGLGAALLLLGLAGCSTSTGGDLSLLGAGAPARSVAMLGASYDAPTLGEFDIVAFSDAGSDVGPPAKGPIRPLQADRQRHVLHVHVYWRAATRLGATPAGVNAAIDYWIMDADPTQARWVRYEGAGLAMVRGRGEHISIELSEVTVKRRAVAGDLTPPFESAIVDGTIIARQDPTRTRQALRELDALSPATRPSPR